MIRTLILFAFCCLAVPAFAKEGISFETAVRQSVACQMKTYPKSTLKDLYKSFFQDVYGPGHLIADTTAAARYLTEELKAVEPGRRVGPIAEPTGWQHNFYRVDLAIVKAGYLPSDLFLDAFVRSANSVEPMPVEAWRAQWVRIEQVIRSMNLALSDYERDAAEIEENLQKGRYVGHHSEAYDEAYAPHYRLIERKIMDEELAPYFKTY